MMFCFYILEDSTVIIFSLSVQTYRPRSEFYFDLLEVFGDPNNNPNQVQRNLNEEPLKLSNPTIIRPKVIPRSSTSIKKPRPAPRLSTHHSSASDKPRSSVKKKPPPPRPGITFIMLK